MVGGLYFWSVGGFRSLNGCVCICRWMGVCNVDGYVCICRLVFVSPWMGVCSSVDGCVCVSVDGPVQTPLFETHQSQVKNLVSILYQIKC